MLFKPVADPDLEAPVLEFIITKFVTETIRAFDLVPCINVKLGKVQTDPGTEANIDAVHLCVV